MPLKNPMYDMMLLKKPSREGVASGMFGPRNVPMAIPNRHANAEAIFYAAPSSRAAMDGRPDYTDYPSWMTAGPPGLRGLGDGGLGSLPDATVYIPINHPGPPWDVGDAVFGISRGWGKIDGLAPGNLRVPNFAARYKKAQATAQKADEFRIDTPVAKMAHDLESRMGDAMKRVLQGYIWDQVCGFGNDPESPVWDNCRSKGQVDRLKTALADVNNTLVAYDQLALAIAKAPPEWKEGYVDYGFDDYAETEPSADTKPSTGQQAYEQAFGNRRTGGSSGATAQSRGASTGAGGIPGWALPVAGVALLGILAGGLVFLKKKKG